MSTFNELISITRETLFSPKENKPTVSQLFTYLSMHLANLYSELDSTSLPWTHQTVTVNVSQGTTDYLVPANSGRVLFASANSYDSNLGPVSLEIADLAEVSADFYPFTPLDYGWSRDFNELWSASRSAQIALFRQGGSLYFRLAPYLTNISTVTLTYSTGDWLSTLNVENTAVLSQHHMLAVVRAATGLLPGTEWIGDRDFNISQRQQMARSLPSMEQGFKQSFIWAKRSQSASEVVTRVAAGGDW